MSSRFRPYQGSRHCNATLAKFVASGTDFCRNPSCGCPRNSERPLNRTSGRPPATPPSTLSGCAIPESHPTRASSPGHGRGVVGQFATETEHDPAEQRTRIHVANRWHDTFARCIHMHPTCTPGAHAATRNRRIVPHAGHAWHTGRDGAKRFARRRGREKVGFLCIDRPSLAENSPDLGRLGPSPARLRPRLAQIRPTSANFGRFLANKAQIWPFPGQSWPVKLRQSNYGVNPPDFVCSRPPQGDLCERISAGCVSC